MICGDAMNGQPFCAVRSFPFDTMFFFIAPIYPTVISRTGLIVYNENQDIVRIERKFN